MDGYPAKQDIRVKFPKPVTWKFKPQLVGSTPPIFIKRLQFYYPLSFSDYPVLQEL